MVETWLHAGSADELDATCWTSAPHLLPALERLIRIGWNPLKVVESLRPGAICPNAPDRSRSRSIMQSQRRALPGAERMIHTIRENKIYFFFKSEHFFASQCLRTLRVIRVKASWSQVESETKKWSSSAALRIRLIGRSYIISSARRSSMFCN